MNHTSDKSNIDRLLEVMRILRSPDGCPWDREQDFSSIAPFTVEEAYEVADAIERGDLHALRDELGDLLFQVVFHARMAEEREAFDFDAVAGAIVDKLERRHPHVFGDRQYASRQEQHADWERMKAEERREGGGPDGALDGVPRALPALSRAAKLTRRAARVGFDWPDSGGALDKIAEEVAELREEVDAGASAARLSDELGDILFAVVNLARKLDVDPEAALRGTIAKFERRFRAIEAELANRGQTPGDVDLEAMDSIWNRVKQREKRSD